MTVKPSWRQWTEGRRKWEKSISLEKPPIRALQWRRPWHPTPVLLPGESHGRRSLVGCSPCGRWESDTTERLHFHVSLSCIGEGNGNPLQCSCLENPRDGGAWWAAVYGVSQSRTQRKRLSSSSKNLLYSTGNYTQYLVITYTGKNQKNNLCLYNWTSLLYIWDTHNIVNKQYSNLKKSLKKLL